MQVAPVLTRRTVELIGEFVERSVHAQLVEWYDSSLRLFDSFLARDLTTMDNTFDESAQRFLPYRIALAQFLFLLLGKTSFEAKYLALLEEARGEILSYAAEKSVPAERLQAVYARYEVLFRGIWDAHSGQLLTPPVPEQLQPRIDQFLITSTQFDFAFTALNLALMDEVHCDEKEKLMLLLNLSSEKIGQFEKSFTELKQSLGAQSPTRNSQRDLLLQLAGSISKEEADAVLKVINKDCERIDAGW